MSWRKHIFSALSWSPVAIFVNETVATCMFVDGRSMQPTFNPEHKGDLDSQRDLVLVLKYPVKVLRQFRKGDVVVMKSPLDPSSKIIKRLTGLEKEWRIRSTGTRKEDIPEGFCWVEGDNLALSEDSNIFGPVPLALLEGRVFCVLWPPNRIGADPHKHRPVSARPRPRQSPPPPAFDPPAPTPPRRRITVELPPAESVPPPVTPFAPPLVEEPPEADEVREQEEA